MRKCGVLRKETKQSTALAASSDRILDRYYVGWYGKSLAFDFVAILVREARKEGYDGFGGTRKEINFYFDPHMRDWIRNTVGLDQR